MKPCSYQDVHAGFVRVTDAPGLGVQIDYDALARLKRNVPDPRHDRPWIARSVLRSAPSPTYMYHLIQPSGRERDGAAVDWYRSDGAGMLTCRSATGPGGEMAFVDVKTEITGIIQMIIHSVGDIPHDVRHLGVELPYLAL